MTLSEFNHLSDEAAEAELHRVCGSRIWAREMARARPYASLPILIERGDVLWRSLRHEDWIEAITAHPRIGETQLRSRWTSEEQSGVAGASEETIRGLIEGNRAYEERFGYVFLICATGKSADEMLSALRVRLKNDRSSEIRQAVDEQAKIARIRLEKLIQ
jgi:OHCU decarboxylase